MDITESKGSVRQEAQKPIGNYCFFKKTCFWFILRSTVSSKHTLTW